MEPTAMVEGRVRRPPPQLYNVNAITSKNIVPPKPKTVAEKPPAKQAKVDPFFFTTTEPDAAIEQAAALKALMAEGLEDVEPTCPREALRNAPELATVLNFLHTFRSHLQLMGFTAEELESALLTPTPSALLARVHVSLLQGIHSRTTITDESWTARLAMKVSAAPGWATLSSKPNPLAAIGKTPLYPAANAAYQALSGKQRALLLAALCELRLEQTTDLRDAIDAEIVKPPKSQVMEHARWVGLEPRFRSTPLALDAAGTTFWFEDHAKAGSRMYTAIPLPPRTTKQKSAAAPMEALWRCVAADATELEALGTKLSSNKWKKDQKLGMLISEELVPGVAAVEEAVERRKRVREQLALDNAVILDAAGGLGRSRRTRKEVNYSDNTTNTDGRDGSADGAPDAVVPERGGRRGRSAAVDEEWEVWEEQPEAMEVDKHPNARRSGRLGAPQEEFVVAQVLEDRVHDGQQQWLIRWQGFDNPSENTWEGYDSLNTGGICQPWSVYEEAKKAKAEAADGDTIDLTGDAEIVTIVE